MFVALALSQSHFGIGGASHLATALPDAVATASARLPFKQSAWTIFPRSATRQLHAPFVAGLPHSPSD
jgi:hypothetical protein